MLRCSGARLDLLSPRGLLEKERNVDFATDGRDEMVRINKRFARGCDLARPRNPTGVNPVCVAASHGRSIQPCSRLGNEAVDA